MRLARAQKIRDIAERISAMRFDVDAIWREVQNSPVSARSRVSECFRHLSDAAAALEVLAVNDLERRNRMAQDAMKSVGDIDRQFQQNIRVLDSRVDGLRSTLRSVAQDLAVVAGEPARSWPWMKVASGQCSLPSQHNSYDGITGIG